MSNLHKIKEIVKIEPVKSNIQSVSYNDMDVLFKLIPKRYELLLKRKLTQINREFRGLYGKNINIPESEVSNVHYNISNIITETGKNFKFFKKKVEVYIGEEVSFVKKDGSIIDYNLIPEINRLINEKKPINEIKKYFNE